MELDVQTLGDRIRAKRRELNISQIELAKKVGITQGALSHLESGRNETSKELPQIALALGVDVHWLLTGQNLQANIPSYTEIHDWDSNTPIEDDEASIIFYKDFHLQCGGGLENLVESNEHRRLRMSKSTLKRLGIEQELAFAATAQDNSMMPTICDGDTVFVDRGRKNIKDGKAFAIEHGGLFRIKRLYKVPNGGVRIVSDNHQEYPEEILTAQDIIEQKFIVLGWVFSIQRLESW